MAGGQGCSRHPISHRTDPTTENTCLRMSIMLRLITSAIVIFLAVQARIFKSSWEYDEDIVFEDFILPVFCYFDSLQPSEL